MRSRVIFSSPHVPWELFEAAGFDPLVFHAEDAPTPDADPYLEAGVFPRRLRQLTQAYVAGDLSTVAALVLPRTDEHDYKTFLYLNEIERVAPRAGRPEVLLFDFLQSRSTASDEYRLNRMRALVHDVERLSGARVAPDEFHAAIDRSNRARASLRALMYLRRPAPRISGVEAMNVIAAFHARPRAEFSTWADLAATSIARRPPLTGPRLVVAGVPVEDDGMHRAVEGRGAVVVAEMGAWGSHAAGADVDASGDPVEALTAKYAADLVGPRTPGARLDDAFDALVDADVDGVVFTYPPEDNVFGWDYPSLANRLDARHIPHVRVRADGHGATNALSDNGAFDDFWRAAAARRETSRAR